MCARSVRRRWKDASAGFNTCRAIICCNAAAGVDTGVAIGVLADMPTSAALADDRLATGALRARVATELESIFSAQRRSLSEANRSARMAGAAIKSIDLVEGAIWRRWLFPLLLLIGLALLGGQFFRQRQPPVEKSAVATASGSELSVAMPAEIETPAPPPAPSIPASVPGKLRSAPAHEIKAATKPTPPAPIKAEEQAQSAPEVSARNASDVASGLFACGDLDINSHAWCMRSRVLRADSRLRAAYDDAVARGVSRDVLQPYRMRWSRMRRDADDDPASVIEGYDEMSRELRHERGRRR